MTLKMRHINSFTATLLVLSICLYPSVLALEKSQWDYTPTGTINNTYQNNTYINQTGLINDSYYLKSNPFDFYNETTLPATDLSGLIPKAYGVSTSSASTNSKSVTIADYTPVAGDIIAVKFTYGSTTTSKWSLAINGVWYTDIWVGGSTATADYLLFSANAVVLLYYDGTKMSVINPTYTNPLKWITLAGTNERPVETIYGYKLAWKDGNNRYRPIIKTSGTTGNNKMPNTVGFRLGSNMVINSGNTNYGTSSTMAKDFNLIGDIGGAYNFNGAFTLWLPVYFKGTVNQTDGLFYFNQANGYTGWYTQTLPTSEDGFVYVYVGNAQSAYGVGLSLNHPAYEFKDGMIRLYGEAKNTHQDNFKEYFGTNNNFSIFSDGTNLVFNTSESGSGLAYFSNNISADYYFGNASYMTGIPAPDLSGLVPYTGATSDVNLNGKNLSNVSLVNVTGNIINTGKTTSDGLVSTGKLTITGITGTAGNAGSVVGITTGTGGANSGSSGTITGGAGGSLNLNANGGTGGSGTNTGTGTAIGGVGGSNSFAGGNGGAALATNSANGVGGKGGNIVYNTFIPIMATGGAASSVTSGTNTGGAGGDTKIYSGFGGTASNGATNTGGAGGEMLISSNPGGAATSEVGKIAVGGAGGLVNINGRDGGTATGGGTNTGGYGSNITIKAGLGGAASGGTSNTAGLNGNILFKIGTTESFRVDGATQNLWLSSDNRKSVWGAGQDASIYYDGTNLVFNTSESGSGLAYFSNNVSATGYITRTSIFDKSKGTALNYIKDASEYLYAKGDINHKAFYGYVEQKVTDFSKPVIDYLPKETCSTDKEDKQVCSIIYEPITTYPYTKIEDGVDLGKEIDVLRQAVYELKMELEKVKSETCTIKLFSWCIK